MDFSITKQKMKRIVIMVLAIILMGFALSLLVRAKMGTDPCSCMNLGITEKIGLPFGIMQLIINSIMLVTIFFVDKSLIGFGTIGNMVLVGFTADFFKGIYTQYLPAIDSMWFRIVLMLIGTELIAISVSLYFSSDLGAAPYDSLAIIVSNKTKIKFKWCRIAIDVTALVIGWALGSTIGLGTVIIACTLGPQITFLNKHLSAKVFRKFKCESESYIK